MPTEKTDPDKKEEREKAKHNRTVELILSKGEHVFNVMVVLPDNSVITVPNVRADTPESALFKAATIKLGRGRKDFARESVGQEMKLVRCFALTRNHPLKALRKKSAESFLFFASLPGLF